MDLLAVSADAKTPKGETLGYLTGICYMTPATGADDGINLCPMSSAGCRRVCLNTAGRGMMSNVQAGRLRKRALFVSDRPAFVARLQDDVATLRRMAARQNLRPACRPNGTTDIAWELVAPSLFAENPDVRFYDYTKIPARMKRYLAGKFPPNYALTFSRSETNDADALEILSLGGNVAVVFDTPKGQALPTEWHGYPVINGDDNDVRFEDPRGVVVGLRAKGQAKHDDSGFVVAAGGR